MEQSSHFNTCWGNSESGVCTCISEAVARTTHRVKRTTDVVYLTWHDIKLHYPSDVRKRTSGNMKQMGRHDLRDFSYRPWTVAWFLAAGIPGMRTSREIRLSTSWIINWAREIVVSDRQFATVVWCQVVSIHRALASCWACLALTLVDWLAKFPQ